MCHVLKFSHVEKSPGNWLTVLTASSVGDESGTGDEVPGKGDIWKHSTGWDTEGKTNLSDFWSLSKDKSHLLMTRKQNSPDNLTLL